MQTSYFVEATFICIIPNSASFWLFSSFCGLCVGCKDGCSLLQEEQEQEPARFSSYIKAWPFNLRVLKTMSPRFSTRSASDSKSSIKLSTRSGWYKYSPLSSQEAKFVTMLDVSNPNQPKSHQIVRKRSFETDASFDGPSGSINSMASNKSSRFMRRAVKWINDNRRERTRRRQHPHDDLECKKFAANPLRTSLCTFYDEVFIGDCIVDDREMMSSIFNVL